MFSRLRHDLTNKVATWTAFRPILSHERLNATFYWVLILPIIANALQNLPPTITLAFQENAFVLELDLPVSWICVYFSILLLSIARLGYLLACPPFVKRFASPADALGAGFTVQYLRSQSAIYIKTMHGGLPPFGSEAGIRMRRVVNAFQTNWEDLRVQWSGGDCSPELRRRISALLRDTPLRESPEDAGYYRFPTDTGYKQIERGQLFRNTATALLDLQDVAHPRLRMMMAATTVLAVGLGAIPVLQGLMTVTRFLLE